MSPPGAGCEWFDAVSDVWAGAVLTTPGHWSVAQASPCLHSSYRRTFWIFTVTEISQTYRLN